MFPESLHRLFADRLEILAGESLPTENGTEPLAYLLISGCITLINRIGSTAAVFWPGDLIVTPGERTGMHMVLKAVAGSVCGRTRKADLLVEASRHHDVIRWMCQQQERREAELHRRLELLTAEGVERRILLTVADLADRSQAASPGLAMPLAQNEVAELAGATRETTSTLLNRMRRRGMVELGRRRIQEAVPDVLRAVSGLSEPKTANTLAAAAVAR